MLQDFCNQPDSADRKMPMSFSEKISRIEVEFGIEDYFSPYHAGWKSPEFLTRMIELGLFNGRNFKKFADCIRGDKDCVSRAVQVSRFSLQCLPFQFAAEPAKSAPEVTLHSIKCDPGNIEFAAAALLTDREFIKELCALRYIGERVARFLPQTILEDIEVVTRLVSVDPHSYQDLPAVTRNNREVVWAAMFGDWPNVRTKPENILQNAPDILVADKQLIERVLQKVKEFTYEKKERVQAIKKLHTKAKRCLKSGQPCV